MSATLYDKALLKKIKTWVKDDSMTITGVDATKDLFEYKADTTGDKPISLPLIALRRDPTVVILDAAKKPLTYDGKKILRDAENSKITQLNAIPITITYRLDIYTKFYDEAEEYLRNFVFNFINFPEVYIEIPYNNSNIKYKGNIKLNTDLQDNSDIPERLFTGQFTRKTITLYIDDAYLFDYRARDTAIIEPYVDVYLDKTKIKN